MTKLETQARSDPKEAQPGARGLTDRSPWSSLVPSLVLPLVKLCRRACWSHVGAGWRGIDQKHLGYGVDSLLHDRNMLQVGMCSACGTAMRALWWDMAAGA
eukprot:TRINITY_DN3428_c0_g1_i3.p2 TRINITY_DN3428_c0_g1~~TRINITY_DN3428_c0_g1_i3.p2  ORF type:complete len:101 (-),score=3.10 TRINITY_DN3428_c0_g1_i3:104-406(-)